MISLSERRNNSPLFLPIARASALPTNATAPYEVGKPYFIRHGDAHYTAVIAVTPANWYWRKLWIADDGDFPHALKNRQVQ